MSVEVLYSLRQSKPGAALRELDDVVLLAPATSDDGDIVPAGTRGTVVGVWSHGKSVIVEFAEPEGCLATVPVTGLMRAEPPAAG